MSEGSCERCGHASGRHRLCVRCTEDADALRDKKKSAKKKKRKRYAFDPMRGIEF